MSRFLSQSGGYPALQRALANCRADAPDNAHLGRASRGAARNESDAGPDVGRECCCQE